MDKQPQKTKICTVCGIRKPLSDFVRDPSKRLKEYSDICQSCRGTKPKETVDDEGGGGKVKKLSIDYFTKRFMAELQEKWLEKQGEHADVTEESSSEEKTEKEEKEKSTEKTDVSQTEKAESRDASKSTFFASSAFSTFGAPSEFKYSSGEKTAGTIPSSGTESSVEKQTGEQIATAIKEGETEKVKSTDKQAQEQKSQTLATTVERENTTSELFKRENQTIAKAAGALSPGGMAEVNRHTKTVERYFKALPEATDQPKQPTQTSKETSESKPAEQPSPMAKK